MGCSSQREVRPWRKDLKSQTGDRRVTAQQKKNKGSVKHQDRKRVDGRAAKALLFGDAVDEVDGPLKKANGRPRRAKCN
jgi:hypothetical protein